VINQSLRRDKEQKGGHELRTTKGSAERRSNHRPDTPLLAPFAKTLGVPFHFRDTDVTSLVLKN